MDTVATVSVELLEDLEADLQSLLDHSVLFPALENRPVLSPILPDLKSSADVPKLIKYICMHGQQAIAAFVAALNATKGECPGHHEALELIRDAVAGRTDSEGPVLLQLREYISTELANKIDVYPLMPRLLQQNLITNENFRELKGPYLTRENRVQRLLEIMQPVGIDGLIELATILRDHGDTQHYEVYELFCTKIQDLMEDINHSFFRNSSTIQKLEKAGISKPSTLTADEDTSSKDKLIIVLSINKYKCLSKSNKIESLTLSTEKQDSFLENLKDKGFYILDFGSELSEINFDAINDMDTKTDMIVQCFNEVVSNYCQKKSVVIIYLSGLAYSVKGITCLLLNDTLNISRNKSDCITDKDILVCIDGLASPFVTVIADCKWKIDKNINRDKLDNNNFPWEHLTRWSTRTVVIANTPDQETFGDLTDVCNNEIASWFMRGKPLISHYQFYQTVVHHCKKTFSLSGDVDRALFGVPNIPLPFYLIGAAVGGDIEICCGRRLIHLVEKSEVVMTLPAEPEVQFKGTIYSVTDTTLIVKPIHPKSIENDSPVYVFPEIISDKVDVKLDFTDIGNERDTAAYISLTNCLQVSKNPLLWSVKVREIQKNKEFEISTSASHKLIVDSIEHIKSLLERFGHYIILQKLPLSPCEPPNKSHYCYFYLKNPKHLLDKSNKQLQLDSSPCCHGDYIADNALCSYGEQKFWMPLPSTIIDHGWFNVMFKQPHYITGLEVRVPVSANVHACPATFVECKSKVNLVTTRFEGPSLAKQSIQIPLHSYDGCGQKQDHSIASRIIITALKMDLSIPVAAFVFRLIPAIGHKNIPERFTIDGGLPSSDIAFTPPLDDNTLTLTDDIDFLTIYFPTTEMNRVALQFDTIKLSAIELQYPQSTVKPVQIFELELYSDAYTTTLKMLQSDRITRTNLETPIIASEVTFRVPPFYQYQFQVYGSEDSIGTEIVAKHGENIKLLFCNNSERPLYLTGFCLEETGAIENIISQEKVLKLTTFTKFIQVSLPSDYKKAVIDKYKILVSHSPLNLGHLQQPGLHDYFNRHNYIIPTIFNQVSDNEEEFYCYQFKVLVKPAD